MGERAAGTSPIFDEGANVNKIANKLGVLASSSLLILMSSAAALADNNISYLDQDGTSNSASVTQSGDNNDAGAAGLEMTQLGFRNRLTINQAGSNNDIGLGVNANDATSGIQQSATHPTLAAHATLHNQLSVTQFSDGNVVGAVRQLFSGDTQINVNVVAITQSGDGGHFIGSVSQTKGSSSGNTATVFQGGLDNYIDRIYQRSGMGGNASNRTWIDMTGDHNGGGVLTGAALASGAQASSVLQGDTNPSSSRNNWAVIDISGDSNQFGIVQRGMNNTIAERPTTAPLTVPVPGFGLIISGNSNEVGLFQSGNDNKIELAEITGDFNNVGISQLGNNNLGGVFIDGDYNGIELQQNGSDNEAHVTIIGNNNGTGNLFGANAAGTVAGTRPSGLIAQLGDDNLVNFTIDSGDFNAFTLEQDGSDNEINHTIDGSSNQVAVVQTGGNNLSSTSQIGSNNVIGVTQ
jgi:hypothetical protein